MLTIGRKSIQPKNRSRLLVIPIISLVTTYLTTLRERTGRTVRRDLGKLRSSRLSTYNQRLARVLLALVRHLAGVLVLRIKNLTLRTIL